MVESKKSRRKPRKQVGVLPYRWTDDGGWEIYLITSRETRRWVIPKGWPMKGRTASGAATQEAFEEAGLVGKTAKQLVGTYVYDKRLVGGGSVPCAVLVYGMAVEKQLDDWPEKGQRDGQWFKPADAAEAVQEDGLAALILGFASGGGEGGTRKAGSKAAGKAKEQDAQVPKSSSSAKSSSTKSSSTKSSSAAKSPGAKASANQKAAEGEKTTEQKAPEGKGSRQGGAAAHAKAGEAAATA